MRTLNLGIVAHVDAGKTTLTERLLFAAGVIDRPGSVDSGSTQTDSLALERSRGITIRSAVVSFLIGGVRINLIDTPGHPDFIAEVERVLCVLDGVVLVVSAVEGVQAQTRVLMRTLQRLRLPTLIFANKIDRAGAREESLLADLADRLTPSLVPMGTVRHPGSRSAGFSPHPLSRPASDGVIEVLSEADDSVLSAYVSGREPLTFGSLAPVVAAQSRRALIHPVYFGSAVTGAGVPELMGAITELLPAAEGDADGPVSGTVFKIERNARGEKVAYVRMHTGTVRVRDRLQFAAGETGKVTGIGVFERGRAVPAQQVGAGRIGTLLGLDGIRIGDPIGEGAGSHDHYFAPPSLETVVVPGASTSSAKVRSALDQLAEQDPLIDVQQDEDEQISVCLYGEVQKEVIEATLAADYGLSVSFRETTTICVERPRSTGTAEEIIGRDGNPFTATLGIRIAAGPPGSGVRIRSEIRSESIPVHIFKAVEEFWKLIEKVVRGALTEGPHGWRVTDCVVTITRVGYVSPGTGAKDYRLLLPLVLGDALSRAGSVVCEPMHGFRLEIPSDTLGAVLPVLGALDAVPRSPVVQGRRYVLEGLIPAVRVHQLQQQLPASTHGEGVLESELAQYRPIRGRPPQRAKRLPDPLNRKEYLLRVLRHA